MKVTDMLGFCCAITLGFLFALPGALRADILVDNNFDDGTSQDWTLSASATIYQYSGSGTDYSYSTPYALDIYSGSGGAYATLTTPLALLSAGYTNVTWSMYVEDLATGYNKYYFQYSKDGGANWINLKTGSLKYLYSGFQTFPVSAPNLSDNFLFRFYVTSNSPSQHTYIDNMLIIATPDKPKAGTVIMLK